MRVIGSGYIGDFTPGRKVQVPFRTQDSTGEGVTWSGLAFAVKPDGSASEIGVSVVTDQGLPQQPAAGNHLVVIDTAADGDPPFYVKDCDYRVILYGDPVDGVPVQGVCVGVFSIANRS